MLRREPDGISASHESHRDTSAWRDFAVKHDRLDVSPPNAILGYSGWSTRFHRIQRLPKGDDGNWSPHELNRHKEMQASQLGLENLLPYPSFEFRVRTKLFK